MTARKKHAEDEILIELFEGFTRAQAMDQRTGDTTSWITPDDKNRYMSKQLLNQIKEEASKQNAKISEHHSSSDAGGLHHSMGFATHIVNQFTVSLVFSSFLAFMTKVGPYLIQWMKNMGGRSVTVKVGHIEIKITGSNDIEKAISAFKELQGLNKQATKEQTTESV